MLWLDAAKNGSKTRIRPPAWVETIALSRMSGIPLADLLELEPLWVTRIAEYTRQTLTQKFDPYR